MFVFSKEGIHFGFLQSWSQVCSWTYWRHPWFLGKKLEKIFQFYAKLRYSLIPYIYSSAYQGYWKAMPIMRPLPLLYPHDQKAEKYIHQYMFGDSLLVTCYTDDLYLPEGKWIDWFTRKKHDGNYEGTYTPPADRGGALFIKAGAIIPIMQNVDYIGEKAQDSLEVRIFPYQESSYTIYDDDGISMGYQNGAYTKIDISCCQSSQHTLISSSARAGSYEDMPEDVTLHFRIFDKKPEAVFVDDKKHAFQYEDSTILIDNLSSKEAHEIKIMY